MVVRWFESIGSSTPKQIQMKPRLVFSRTQKVKRSFTIDDKIIRHYSELYGISIRDARQRYKMFLLQTRLNNANIYA
jgi:hypothetical protein